MKFRLTRDLDLGVGMFLLKDNPDEIPSLSLITSDSASGLAGRWMHTLELKGFRERSSPRRSTSLPNRINVSIDELISQGVEIISDNDDEGLQTRATVLVDLRHDKSKETLFALIEKFIQ